MSMQNKKLENHILSIFLYFYTVVSRKHLVGFSKLYGGDFNRFTTLVMVDLSLGSTLVSSFNANSNRTFVLFGSGVFGTSLKLNHGDIFSSPRLLQKRTPNILCACVCEPFLLEIRMSPASLVCGIILELHSSTSLCVLPPPPWTPSHSLTKLPHSSTLTFSNRTHQ